MLLIPSRSVVTDLREHTLEVAICSVSDACAIARDQLIGRYPVHRKLSDSIERLNGVRIFIAVVLAGLLLATACTDDPATTDNAAPEVSPEVQAELTVAAIAAACGDLCVGQPLYVRDQLLDTDTLVGDEDPMPQAIKEAISDSYSDVTWVDLAGADAILEEVADAQAVLLVISPLAELAAGVQGIEVGVTHGAFHGQIIQFQWNGTEWVQADSEDTGVTVTSAVS